jgi:hypothetical protein
LLGDAEWDYETKNYANLDSYAKTLESKYSKYKDTHTLYFGRMYRILADVQFKQNGLDKAFRHYAEAFILFTKRQGFGRYTIERELLRLQRKMDTLNTKDATRWISYLQEKWRPENKSVLTTWCDEQLRHAKLRALR